MCSLRRKCNHQSAESQLFIRRQGASPDSESDSENPLAHLKSYFDEATKLERAALSMPLSDQGDHSSRTPQPDYQSTSVQPAALHSHSSFTDYDTTTDDEARTGYAGLLFPDILYLVKSTSVVLGRNPKTQRVLERCGHVKVAGVPVRTPSRASAHNQNVVNADIQPSEDDEDDEENSGGSEIRTSLIGGISSNVPDNIPSQDEEIFLPIHPPGDSATGQIPGLGSISKRHLRMFMENNTWWLHVLGRNGCYIDNEHVPRGTTRELQHEQEITVSGLSFKFLDQDQDEIVTPDDSGSDELDQNSAHLSGSSQDSLLGDSQSDIDLEDPIVLKKPMGKLKLPEKLKIRLPTEPKGKGKGKGKGKTKVDEPVVSSTENPEKKAPGRRKEELKVEDLLLPGETLPRRSGPGRPPKNGLLSKREMAERLRKQKQAAVENGTDEPKSQSRNRKESFNEEEEGDSLLGSTKKPLKRKKKDEVGDPADDSSTLPEKKKKKKEPEPTRSPSPKKEDYTEEQCAHPHLTYQALIYIILSEAERSMGLQELYRAIKKKWPYFRFNVPSNGWESSVRHTVGTNKDDGPFLKEEKPGKGSNFRINPLHPPPSLKPRAGPTAQTNVSQNNLANSSAQPRNNFPYSHPQHNGITQPGMYQSPFGGPLGHPPPFANGIRPPGLPPHTQYSSPYGTNNRLPQLPQNMNVNAVGGVVGAGLQRPNSGSPFRAVNPMNQPSVQVTPGSQLPSPRPYIPPQPPARPPSSLQQEILSQQRPPSVSQAAQSQSNSALPPPPSIQALSKYEPPKPPNGNDSNVPRPNINGLSHNAGPSQMVSPQANRNSPAVTKTSPLPVLPPARVVPHSEMSALELLRAGKIPSKLLDFKAENHAKWVGTKKAERYDALIENACQWVIKHPREEEKPPDNDGAMHASLVKTLWVVLNDDHDNRTQQRRRAGISNFGNGVSTNSPSHTVVSPTAALPNYTLSQVKGIPTVGRVTPVNVGSPTISVKTTGTGNGHVTESNEGSGTSVLQTSIPTETVAPIIKEPTIDIVSGNVTNGKKVQAV